MPALLLQPVKALRLCRTKTSVAETREKALTAIRSTVHIAVIDQSPVRGAELQRGSFRRACLKAGSDVDEPGIPLSSRPMRKKNELLTLISSMADDVTNDADNFERSVSTRRLEGEYLPGENDVSLTLIAFLSDTAKEKTDLMRGYAAQVIRKLRKLTSKEGRNSFVDQLRTYWK